MAQEQDTIVAISTPVGRGGIGVVRLSGAHAREIVEPLLRLRHQMAAGRARFGVVLDVATGAVLDEAVVTYFAAPHSYTGEDVVEIAPHGSPVLLEYLVRQCCANGARLAEPGEFTQRAFLAGRIDLTQAEAVDDLIGSSTLEQARVAARQMGGALAKIVAPVKAELVSLIATMEAGIDFAEDDIDVMPASAIVAKIESVRAPLQDLERSFAYGRVVRDGFKLAIVGRPNAGKSSLFNRLVDRDRAIVTSTPGTTRDLVTERVAIDGIPVDLIDTAGLRQAADEAERIGIAKSHEAMADADVVLLVVDAVVGMEDEDRAVLERGALVAWNKSDLLTEDSYILPIEQNAARWIRHPVIGAVRSPDSEDEAKKGFSPALLNDQQAALQNRDQIEQQNDNQIEQQNDNQAARQNDNQAARQNVNKIVQRNKQAVVRTSAVTGEGIPELRAAIVAAVAGDAGGVREAGMVTNLRQHQAVAQALRGLDAARAAVDAEIPHEMVMLDLYDALRGLDALTGATTSEDVLRLIFSKFCIGK